VTSPEEKEKKKDQRGGEALRRTMQERRMYDEMVVKAGVLKHIKDPYREKLRDAIRNRVDSYSKSIVKASSGLMHLVREMYRDVTHMETVEIPDEFFDKKFIRQLMLGTKEARMENERVHALHENFAEFRFEGTQYRDDRDIYDYGAMKYLTNLKNRLTVNLERFMIRAVFALYPGHLSQRDMGDYQWHHEQSPACRWDRICRQEGVKRDHECSFCNPCGYARAPCSFGAGESDRQDIRVEKR